MTKFFLCVRRCASLYVKMELKYEITGSFNLRGNPDVATSLSIYVVGSVESSTRETFTIGTAWDTNLHMDKYLTVTLNAGPYTKVGLNLLQKCSHMKILNIIQTNFESDLRFTEEHKASFSKLNTLNIKSSTFTTTAFNNMSAMLETSQITTLILGPALIISDADLSSLPAGDDAHNLGYGMGTRDIHVVFPQRLTSLTLANAKASTNISSWCNNLALAVRSLKYLDELYLIDVSDDITNGMQNKTTTYLYYRPHVWQFADITAKSVSHLLTAFPALTLLEIYNVDSWKEEVSYNFAIVSL